MNVSHQGDQISKKNWGHFDGFLGDLASWKDIMKELDVAINWQIGCQMYLSN